ncbi:MAG: asparagine synthase-related protein [Gracilimonas sp.]|nr:asparagine synthase-related protein [Gracilimonas sp.]
MAGIYGLYSSSDLEKKSYSEYFFSNNMDHIINQDMQYRSFLYGRSVLNKFNNDRFIIENDHNIICIEGINYENKNWKDNVELEYTTKGIDFVKKDNALFAGFIFDKRLEKLFLFTDHLGTKALYFYHDKLTHSFLFASELKVLTKACSDNDISLNPSIDGFNCLLSFGYMLDDLTPVESIKKIKPGTILCFDIKTGTLSENRYFRLKKEKISPSKEESIENIDRLVLSSIENEWRKDLEYEIPSFAFLSGGLDSRVNVLLADKMGFHPSVCLNFSQTGAPDHTIAKRIADQEGFNYTFYKLDKGHYFINQLERLVEANSGMTTLNRAAHMFRAIENFSYSDKGLAHSGQIGDVLFGSFIKPGFDLESDVGKLGSINDPKILNQISILSELTKSYDNDVELFSYEQRQINGTMDGDKTIAHFTDVSSPFYNKALLKYCYNLPDKYKQKKLIYLEWMLQKHPELLDYPLDMTGTKYSNPISFNIFRFYKKGRRFIQKKFGYGNELMNPYDLWFKQNDQLQSEIDQSFTSHINMIRNKQLRHNIKHVFNYNVQGKFNAVTALLTFKLHFSNDRTSLQ